MKKVEALPFPQEVWAAICDEKCNYTLSQCMRAGEMVSDVLMEAIQCESAAALAWLVRVAGVERVEQVFEAEARGMWAAIMRVSIGFLATLQEALPFLQGYECVIKHAEDDEPEIRKRILHGNAGSDSNSGAVLAHYAGAMLAAAKNRTKACRHWTRHLIDCVWRGYLYMNEMCALVEQIDVSRLNHHIQRRRLDVYAVTTEIGKAAFEWSMGADDVAVLQAFVARAGWPSVHHMIFAQPAEITRNVLFRALPYGGPLVRAMLLGPLLTPERVLALPILQSLVMRATQVDAHTLLPAVVALLGPQHGDALFAMLRAQWTENNRHGRFLYRHISQMLSETQRDWVEAHMHNPDAVGLSRLLMIDRLQRGDHDGFMSEIVHLECAVSMDAALDAALRTRMVGKLKRLFGKRSACLLHAALNLSPSAQSTALLKIVALMMRTYGDFGGDRQTMYDTMMASNEIRLLLKHGAPVVHAFMPLLRPSLHKIVEQHGMALLLYADATSLNLFRQALTPPLFDTMLKKHIDYSNNWLIEDVSVVMSDAAAAMALPHLKAGGGRFPFLGLFLNTCSKSMWDRVEPAWVLSALGSSSDLCAKLLVRLHKRGHLQMAIDKIESNFEETTRVSGTVWQSVVRCPAAVHACLCRWNSWMAVQLLDHLSPPTPAPNKTIQCNKNDRAVVYDFVRVELCGAAVDRLLDDAIPWTPERGVPAATFIIILLRHLISFIRERPDDTSLLRLFARLANAHPHLAADDCMLLKHAIGCRLMPITQFLLQNAAVREHAKQHNYYGDSALQQASDAVDDYLKLAGAGEAATAEIPILHTLVLSALEQRYGSKIDPKAVMARATTALIEAYLRDPAVYVLPWHATETVEAPHYTCNPLTNYSDNAFVARATAADVEVLLARLPPSIAVVPLDDGKIGIRLPLVVSDVLPRDDFYNRSVKDTGETQLHLGMLRAYLTHPLHTAVRCLVGHARSSVSLVLRESHYSSAMLSGNNERLAALLWLATTDERVVYDNAASIDVRVAQYAMALADVLRGHNIDKVVTKTVRQRDGVTREVQMYVDDDGLGDNASCSRGMANRLFGCLAGNPVIAVRGEGDLSRALSDRATVLIAGKLRALFVDDAPLFERIERALTDHVVMLEPLASDDLAAIRGALNLSRAEQDALFSSLTEVNPFMAFCEPSFRARHFGDTDVHLFSFMLDYCEMFTAARSAKRAALCTE